jgi:hypothetical protein
VGNPTKNKKAGAEWENRLKNNLREVGEDIEHLHLNGAEDEGDLVIREEGGHHLVIEAKAGEKVCLGTWVREMETEVEHYAKHRGLDPELVDGIVIAKRARRPWSQAYVITTVERYFGLDGS